MENINDKIYSKPSEMYSDTCLFISEQLNEYGFKYLKSQSLVKKIDKNLVYTINFGSSHYNYIEKNEGHVQFNFACFISSKETKKKLFYLSQRTLMGLYEYELFHNCKIDLKSIQTAIEFIKEHFLSIIFMIEKDINALLEEIAKKPAVSFDNYNYRYEKEIFEVFKRIDLIDKFNKNIEIFNSKSAERNYNDFKKHLQIEFNKNKILELDFLKLENSLSKIYLLADIKEKIGKNYYDIWENLYKKLEKMKQKDQIEWAIDYYIFLTNCKDYLKDEEGKTELLNIYSEMLECLN